ncbi:aldo/keto reductase [Microlunatus sp. GCM10028923]|uniref:aldo/keto reductase n=1 Tax=Microlunatus sp. GCM10028923 TaxID=3273400 RepID=UPI0036180E49
MTAPTMITLRDGAAVPQLGLGVFEIPPDQVQATVEVALAAGYRHLDTAAAYVNEAGVGAALRATGLPRDEVFVTTKLRNGDQGYESALRAYDDSCRRLGLDRVDLYLIHWPNPAADRYVDSWRALERLAAERRVGSIGVSNFLAEHLERLAAEGDQLPAVNQIELHPTYQQVDVVRSCAERGIAVEAYSPLGRGADLSHPAVHAIADDHRRTPAQVLLRWHLQRGHIVIPKSATPERIRANAEVFDFALTGEEVTTINGLEAGRRTGNDPRTFAASQLRPIPDLASG